MCSIRAQVKSQDLTQLLVPWLLAHFPPHISEMFDSCRSKHFIRSFNRIDERFRFLTFSETFRILRLWVLRRVSVDDDRKISWTAVTVNPIHQAVQNRPWRELTGKKISFSVEWWWRLGATRYIYFRIPTSVARWTLSLMYKPMKGECQDSANRQRLAVG